MGELNENKVINREMSGEGVVLLNRVQLIRLMKRIFNPLLMGWIEIDPFEFSWQRNDLLFIGRICWGLEYLNVS